MGLSFLQELKQFVPVQTYFEEGLKAMMRGIYAVPRSEADIQSAVHSFKEAVRLNDSKLDSYLSLSYLLIGLGKFDLARQCLEDILAFDSTHKEAQFYMSLCAHKPASFDMMPPLMGFIHKLQDLTPEILYDLLDELVMMKMTEVALRSQNFKPQPDPAILKPAEDYLPELIRFSQFMLENVIHLEMDMDTTPLRLKLEPLELMMNQLEKTVEDCRRLVEIKNKLDELSRTLGQAIQMLSQNPSDDLLEKGEQLREEVWEQADLVKTDMFEFENQGINISTLQQYYDMMMILVNHLEDALDG